MHLILLILGRLEGSMRLISYLILREAGGLYAPHT